MKCEDVQMLLSDYADGQLPPADTEHVREHLASCPACAREAGAQRRLHAAFRASPAPQPGPRLHAMFHTWLEAEKEAAEFRARELTTPRTSWLRNLMGPGASAVAACTVFAVGLLVGDRLGSKPAPAGRDEAATREIAQLRQEVETMNKTVAWSLLQQQPASERLQTVRALETSTTRGSTINELLSVLAYDSSPTVRRSAVEALYRYAAEPAVPHALATALPRENSPVVQLAMIDLLAVSRDPVAATALATFARSDAPNSAVRDAASVALTRM